MWFGVGERICGECVLEFSLCSRVFPALWELSLSFCLWIFLKIKPHFCSISIQLQLVVANLELLQFVLMRVPLKWIWWQTRSTFLFCE